MLALQGQRGDRPAHRMADQHQILQVQRTDEVGGAAGEVEQRQPVRIVLGRIPEALHIQPDVAEIRRQVLQHRFPGAGKFRESVDQQHRLTGRFVVEIGDPGDDSIFIGLFQPAAFNHKRKSFPRIRTLILS